MKKLLPLWLFLLVPIVAFAQTPARFDLPVLTTTPAQVPVDSLPDLLAVTNATISVCQYPAALTDGMCTNKVTTYTDSTLATSCDPTAQLTAPGTSVCISTTGLQGSFGFWYDASVQTHMTYTVKTKWGTFGPFDILSGGGSGSGSGTVTNFSAGNLAPLFTTSVGNSTTTPGLTFTASAFAPHAFYGNSGGSTGAPAANLLGTSDWSPNAYVAGAGSAQTQTVTLAPAATALTAGLEVRWLPVAANTATAPTLNVNGLGARVITKNGTTGLVANDLTMTTIADAIYDGTRWQLQNPQTSSAGAGIQQLTGDVLAGPGSGSQAATLPTVNSNVGACGDSTHVGQVTLNAKGLTTACTPVAITGTGGTPAGVNGNPQINASGAFGAAGNVFYQQSGDTIASIETMCSSLCTYVVTSPQAFTLAASHTLSANVQLRFEANGNWTVNGSSFTLTIPGHVEGTTTQHFVAGTGSVKLGILNNALPVEWFGAVGDGSTDNLATIQACVNALTMGQCLIQNGVYNIAGTLSFTASSIGLRGNPAGRGGWQSGAATYIYSTLAETTAGADAIDVHGTSSAMLNFGRFEDFTIISKVAQTGTAAGLSCSFAGGLIARNLLIKDFVRNAYIHACPSFGGGGWYEVSTQQTSVSGTTGTFYGFYLDSADGHAQNSLNIIDSSYAQSGNSGLTTYGLAAIGTDVNDWTLHNFQTAASTYGIYISRTTGSGTPIASSDIHLIDSILDGCLTACVSINNLSLAGQGSVDVVGGWFSPAHSVGAPAFDIENSSGVQIDGSMINAGYTTGSSIVKLNGATHTAITGNTIQATAGAIEIWLTGNSTYNSIAGNTLFGTSATGIQFDAGSNNNTYDGLNRIDPTNIPVPVSDSGTGNGFHASSITTTGTNPYIESGTASNSDLAGQLTLSGGTATYTFANTYASAPICTATDTTAANAVKVSTSTTVLTLTGTATDVIHYLCIGRN